MYYMNKIANTITIIIAMDIAHVLSISMMMEMAICHSNRQSPIAMTMAVIMANCIGISQFRIAITMSNCNDNGQLQWQRQ